MDTPRKSQKDISNQYGRHLRIYRKINLGRLGRFLVTFFAICIGIALIIAYERRGSGKFVNPGKLANSHAHLIDNCASCHGNPPILGRGLTRVKFQQTLSDRFSHGVVFDPIDNNCEICHEKQDRRLFDFHQSNVVANRSCSLCHPEHRGLVSLRQVGSFQCATCHNNQGVMAASAALGRQQHMDPEQRHPQPPQQVVFNLSRPVDGYTTAFAAFWDGHPEFQLKRKGETKADPDVLKFNHKRHFAADIPPVNNQKLECAFCHKPDPQGRFNQRITFAAHCQVCHSLQFDSRNPELMLPHGDTAAVRGFLQDLPVHYADLAAKKGLTNPNDIKNFVTQQMLQLRERLRYTYPAITDSPSFGAAFENQVFFVANPYRPQPGMDLNKAQAGMDASKRALFYGCALCHDPKRVPNDAPYIEKPVFVDRWMPQSPFDHAKHKMVDCTDCHHAKESRLTSDVLMPGINDCNTCHSPKGKILANNQNIVAAAECITCHTYHAPAGVALAQINTR